MTARLAIALAPLRWTALLAGLLGAGLSCAAYLWKPADFFAAYLVAWLALWSISAGALAIAMIHHLTGGLWGMAIRRILEAAYGLMPLVALLAVPLWFGLPTLYPWARPSDVAGDPLLVHKSPYLNGPAFSARAVAYFLVWSLLGLILNSLSAGEPSAEPRRRRWLALVSGPGLILWGLCLTFASIDWSMSLEPHWFSSSYGVLIAAGSGVAAMALAVAVVASLSDMEPWEHLATPSCLNDLGNFLLAFVLFWSYIAYTQFLIIWSGNLPEEAPWYLHRSQGGWQWPAALLAAFHFAVPFLLLLSRRTKRQASRLLAVAILLLAMRLVEWHWLVTPALHPERFYLSWVHLAAVLAVGGLWLAAFTWQLERRARFPVYELPAQASLPSAEAAA